MVPHPAGERKHFFERVPAHRSPLLHVFSLKSGLGRTFSAKKLWDVLACHLLVGHALYYFLQK